MLVYAIGAKAFIIVSIMEYFWFLTAITAII